jgi:predicted dehydrogenase
VKDSCSPGFTRRTFLGASAGAYLASQLHARDGATGTNPLRIAQVGTGARGSDWALDIVHHYRDDATIVGLCDINLKRAHALQQMLGTNPPVYSDFDRMVKETSPEAILITTVDAAHTAYIVSSLKLGLRVLCEKPVCIDEAQCREVLAAEKKYPGKLTITFNARHYPGAKKVKALLLEGAIGDVVSADYHEYLDTVHGASYFRRWHRLKELSGTLSCTKSCHHFDQVNWWLGSAPRSVSAQGELRFYGRNNAFRSSRCRGCPYASKCDFFWDARKDPKLVKLFLDCESEDGYFIDGCLWRMDVNIYDTFSALVQYENGARLTYTANSFGPYEGQKISLNGTRGRIDWSFFGDVAAGYEENLIRLTRNFGKSEVVPVRVEAGGHDGADASLRDMIFRNRPSEDPLSLGAGTQAGIDSSLIGIATYRSIERGGQLVGIADLLKSSLASVPEAGEERASHRISNPAASTRLVGQ